MKALHTVLASVDFSHTSSLALDYAKKMIRRFEASLHLLRVVTDADVSPGTEVFLGFSEDTVQQKWVSEATTKLATLCPADEQAALRVQTTVEVGTRRSWALCATRAHEVDLIVMGTHGRGAVQHLLLGSVAEQIVRQASCPVLTVRNPTHEFEAP